MKFDTDSRWIYIDRIRDYVTKVRLIFPIRSLVPKSYCRALSYLKLDTVCTLSRPPFVQKRAGRAQQQQRPSLEKINKSTLGVLIYTSF